MFEFGDVQKIRSILDVLCFLSRRQVIIDVKCQLNSILTIHLECITLYYMKNSSSITIRLDRDLKRMLDQVCKKLGRTRSDIIRDALRRQLALAQFEQLRRQVMPFAEARGYLTDEDVQKEIS